MTSIFQGLPFHLYGLIVGLAIVISVSIIEKFYIKLGHSENIFWKIITLMLIFGIVGARAWHVGTDFYLYENNLWEVFYVWNGGLSIFGGIFGGAIGVFLATRLFKEAEFLEFLDIAVFALPIGQAIGRLGNYVNQELYGLPSGEGLFSIFKIFISQENRLAGYENIEYYHPLFFYEMIAMLVFGGIAYYLYFGKLGKKNKDKLPKIGSGQLFLIYVLYYSVIRFLLDFIRLDKTIFEWLGKLNWLNLGINQVVLLAIACFAVIMLIKKSKNILLGFFIIVLGSILTMYNLSKPPKTTLKTFNNASDGEIISIYIQRGQDQITSENSVSLNVELANNQKSTQLGLSFRDEIGSDGLLFIFPQSSKRTFWMYEMKFDLDMVWINGDRVVGFSKNVKKPALGASNQDIETAAINSFSDKVLELNSGDIDRYKIEVGDVVILK